MVRLRNVLGDDLTHAELGAVLSLKEITTYQRQLEQQDVGVLPLFDFCNDKVIDGTRFLKLHYRGTILSVENTGSPATPHIVSSIPVAKLADRSKLTAKQLKELETDEWQIRALMDKFMIETGNHFRRVTESGQEKPKGFWRPLLCAQNIDLMAAYAINHAAEEHPQYEYAHTDTKPMGALPIQIRNFGATDKNGFNAACDVLVVQHGRIVAGKRPDEKEKVSLFGGLNEERMKMAAANTIFELFDEALGAGLLGSAHFQALINAIPKNNAELLKLLERGSTPLGDDQLVVDAVRQKSDGYTGADLDKRVKQAKLCKAVMILAEKQYKIANTEYVDTTTLLQIAVHQVTKADGTQLAVLNRSEHRATSEGATRSAINFVYVDAALAQELQARGLNFTAGDDIGAIVKEEPQEFLKKHWGGHGQIVIETQRVLAEKDSRAKQLTEPEQALKDVLDRGVAQFEQDEDGLKAAIEKIATNLLDMVLSYSESRLDGRKPHGMFAKKSQAAEFIRRERGSSTTDVMILNTLLQDGSTRPQGKYSQSLHVLESLVPKYMSKDTEHEKGCDFLRRMLSQHPQCQPDLSSRSRLRME